MIMEYVLIAHIIVDGGTMTKTVGEYKTMTECYEAKTKLLRSMLDAVDRNVIDVRDLPECLKVPKDRWRPDDAIKHFLRPKHQT